jgi:hypothetical protein
MTQTHKKTDKKDLLIRPCPNHPPLYEVHYSCGGEVPKMLQGRFTNKGEIHRKIALYLSKKPQRKSKLQTSKELAEAIAT